MNKGRWIGLVFGALLTARATNAWAEEPRSSEPSRAAGWVIIGLGGGLGAGSAVTGGVLSSTASGSGEDVGTATLAGGLTTVALSLLIGVPLVLLTDSEEPHGKRSSVVIGRALSGHITW